MASLLVPVPASAAPAIKFLNPSGYTAALTLSGKPDVNPTYHLVVWASELPSNPVVEFEFTSATGQSATFDGTRVGTDTWEANANLAAVGGDGPYTLRAFLYSGTTEVASDELNVTVNNQDMFPPPAAETVEMTWPDNGAQLGFFSPPGGGRPTTVIDVTTSGGAQQVRSFYTLEKPGAVPDWQPCGSAGVSVPENSQTGTASIRCTLGEGHSANQVTAVASVANQTPPPAPPNEAADQSGDAHRVVPYTSKPARVLFDDSTKRHDDLTKCVFFTAFVVDQLERPLPGANVDLHAVGPDDQLRFGVDSIAQGSTTNNTDEFKAPDKNHSSTEPAARCSDGTATSQNANIREGDHNTPQQPDTKHIESGATGTLKDGSFRFALMSASNGATSIEVWADEDDDDRFGGSEARGGAQLGWGQEPPPPQPTLELTPDSASPAVGECQSFTAVARLGGNPVPGANIDAHMLGPDANANFCDPGGGSVTRPPEQGAHVSGAHEDGTRHVEGEADSAGRFVFGITSTAEGVTDVLVWRDSPDDDTLASEASDTAQITWQPVGTRTLSLQANRSIVTKGRKVRLSGAIDGSSACEAGQTVELHAKPKGQSNFGVVATTTSDDGGAFSFRPKVAKRTKFRAVAPEAGSCDEGRSKTVTVKTRKKRS